MSRIPLDKLEQLRREQNREEAHEERPVLYSPDLHAPAMVSGSMEPDDEQERGVAIIDFTI